MTDIVQALLHEKGNLLDLAEEGKFDIIVQGCNCFNTMGGGIAREIRERFAGAAQADGETRRGDYNKLGTWSSYDTGEFVIINAYTQYNMSHGNDVFEYVSFQLILQKLEYMYSTSRIGFPYIGMGLAGGDKDTIMQMLEEFACRMRATGGTVTLVEFAV